MDYLLIYLQKDLVNIINDYAKDRTQYDKVIKELRSSKCCFWEGRDKYFRLEFTFFKKNGYLRQIKIIIKVLSDDDNFY